MRVGRYYLNTNPLLSVKTTCQLAVALIASALLMHYLLDGVNGWVLLKTLIATYALKDTLAPATGFWKDYPSWVATCITAVLVIASSLFLPVWIAIVAVSSVFGLGFGRCVGKFVSSKLTTAA
jgi:hypothetical protein